MGRVLNILVDTSGKSTANISFILYSYKIMKKGLGRTDNSGLVLKDMHHRGVLPPSLPNTDIPCQN